MLLAKPRSRMETVNDIDEEIMTFWRVLRERPMELARACALTPHSRAEHLLSRERDADDEIERARRIWIALTQGRAGQLTRTGWRYYVSPGGSSLSMPGYLAAYVERMAAAAERLHAVSLECRPALDVIEAYGSHPGNLLYVDPPYLGSTRAHGKSYRHEMRDEADHRDLAAALNRATASVVLSGYHSPLYDELFTDWHRLEFAAYTAQGNAREGAPTSRVEVIWSNRPLNTHPTLDFAGMEA